MLFRRLTDKAALLLASSVLLRAAEQSPATRKKLIVDTDIFSDVDDAGALLLASTFPNVDLLAVNVNYPSSYSAFAVSAILAHYGHADVPVGLLRPVTNTTFFDALSYEYGEYASKVAYHWSNQSLPWDKLTQYWNPVDLYRKVLAAQEDGSVTIASIGFFENLSGLLNSTADAHSPLSGPDLIARKVSELVIMGGAYPTGHEFNFYGDDPALAAHVVRAWPTTQTFSGEEMGGRVLSRARGRADDPVRAAYAWYVGANASRPSWDPLTVLYACAGLGTTFAYAAERGYNEVAADGSNAWVFDGVERRQRWLRLTVDNATAGALLDGLYVSGAEAAPVSLGVSGFGG